MRIVSSDTQKKIDNPIQTRGNNNDPITDLWIGRLTTPLTGKTSRFLERQTVLTGSISDSSMAVCHPKANAENTQLFIGYVQNGMAHVSTASTKTRMASHSWTSINFSEPAEHISIAFDGTMPKNITGRYEFITESLPWVFWENGGILYARKIYSSDTVVLASANCTWISAVRATWSEIPDWDFGLCVFFIVSGVIYYRQLINGLWYDAEVVPVASLPTLASGVTWIEVAASRTWDYRVVLQLKASDGALYEVFTQFGGFGSKGAEHIEVRDVSATGKLTAIKYANAAENEHVEIASVTAGAPYGGLYSMAIPKIISASNADDGTGNCGKLATFTFDVHLKAAEVAAQASAFSIVDVNSVTYNAATASLGVDGKTVTLTFTDFNNARGECRATYTAGTVTSMAGTALATTSHSFTPTGLVPTAVPVPEVSTIQNV